MVDEPSPTQGRDAARGGRRAVTALAALALALALAPAAAARSYVLTFDDAAAGTVLGSGPGGLSFAGSPVVAGAGSKAASPPNILRRQGDCRLWMCPAGDHRIVMSFASPARSVSLRAGVPLTANESCEANQCPLGRLVGFDALGRVVAVSPEELIHYADMRRNPPLEATAEGPTIVRAVFAIGENPQTGAHRGNQYTAQIDDLRYDVVEIADPPPPPAPAGPTIQITDPSPGQSFASTDVGVRGRAAAPAGVAEGCAAANAPAAPPRDCRQTFRPAADGTFAVGYVAGLRPGANEIRVWLRDVRNRVATASVRVVVPSGDVDYAIRTLDINQVVQVKPLPVARETFAVPAIGNVAGDTYAGVPLASGKRTIVRVFGEARGAPGPVRGVPAALRGYATIGGRLRELPFSPLNPSASPAQLAPVADVAKLRAGTSGDWTFVLPDRWTEFADVTLVAEVAPGSITAPATDCCPRNNHFGVRGLRFRALRRMTVYPVALTYRTASPPVTVAPANPLRDYYASFVKVWPGELTIAPPRAAIDVSDLMTAPDVAAAWNARLLDTFRNAGLVGKVSGLVNDGRGGLGPGPTSATGSITRGLDFVAHEVGHSVGLAHAHTGAGDGCPSDPNLRGRINGVGIDPSLWSADVPGRFKTIAAEEPGVFDATPDAPAEIFDYMSYCSDEAMSQTWVAPGYWANTVRELRVGGRVVTDFSGGCCFVGAAGDPTVASDRAGGVRAAAAGAAPRSVTVTAALGEGRDRILGVREGDERPTPAAPASDVELVVRDSGGRELSRTRVAATPLAGRPAPGERDVHQRLVYATVPGAGAGAASVEILVAGRVVASRRASVTAPRVALRSPAAGARIGSRGRLTVRWSLSDRDRDPLKSTVEFSSDRGRRWKPLGVVPNGGSTLRIAAAELPRATRGILRVRVVDGFRTATAAVSGLRTAGGRPAVRIVSPAGETRLRSDMTVTLEGQAFDDEGRPLAGQRLTWRTRGRRLGHGAKLDVPAGALGAVVTLTARDRAGRAASARVTLAVKRVAPLFQVLVARLPRAGRTIALRAAASQPATLSITGRGVRPERARLGGRTVTIRVRTAGRRRSSYVLTLVLSANGRRTTRTLTIR